jgi:energy-converting hydrogenase Eha subunit A
MSSSDLIRWGGLAALVGGVLFVVAELLGLPTINIESFSETATTASFAIQTTTFLLGVVLMLLGLVGLYARQSEAAGALGLIGFLVAFLGTVLIGGFRWASVFIAPALATEVPEFLDARGPPPGLIPTFIIFAVGWLVFGIATLRGRVFPRAAAILLIVGAVVTILPLPFTTLVFDVAVAWLGFILFTGREGSAEHSPRVS